MSPPLRASPGAGGREGRNTKVYFGVINPSAKSEIISTDWESDQGIMAAGSE